MRRFDIGADRFPVARGVRRLEYCQLLAHSLGPLDPPELAQASERRHASYDNKARTRLSLEKETPISRPIEPFGRIVAEPMVGGLQHRYTRIQLSVATGRGE